MCSVLLRHDAARRGRYRTALLAAISLAPVALGGCAAAPAAAPSRAVEIAPHLRFLVPSPGALGYSISVEQLVTAHYRGDVRTFEAHLSVSPERLVLIGFDPFGGRAFTLTWAAGAIRFEAAQNLPEGLNPSNILADLAIVYWPAAAVRRGLPAEAELQTGETSRSVIADGHEIIRVDYDTPFPAGWPKAAHYRNEAFGYALDLQSTVTDQ